MMENISEHMDNLAKGEASRFKRRIHAVVFFINAATIATDDEEEMNVVRGSCSEVRFVLLMCC